jgi:hypothetical protein
MLYSYGGCLKNLRRLFSCTWQYCFCDEQFLSTFVQIGIPLAMTTLSDEQLFLLIKQDSGPAFDEIYNRYWYTLFNSAYKRLRPGTFDAGFEFSGFDLMYTPVQN